MTRSDCGHLLDPQPVDTDMLFYQAPHMRCRAELDFQDNPDKAVGASVFGLNGYYPMLKMLGISRLDAELRRRKS